MNIDYMLCVSVAVILAFLLPLTLSAIASKKFTKLRVILAGAGVFVLFQLIIRLPLINIIQYFFPKLVPTGEINAHLVIYSAIMALTAGIFEEFGRYIGLVTVLKKYRSWGDGLGYGIGHGGIEALVLVGLPSITWLFTNVLEPGQPTWYAAIGGVERLFAICVQIGFSMLVMYGVYKKKFSYVLLAVFAHMAVDFPLVLLSKAGGILLAEGYTALCAIVSLVWVVKSKKLFGEKPALSGAGDVQSINNTEV